MATDQAKSLSQGFHTRKVAGCRTKCLNSDGVVFWRTEGPACLALFGYEREVTIPCWVGPSTNQLPPSQACKSLDFLEVGPRANPPRPGTVGKWRESCPEHMRLSWVVDARDWKADPAEGEMARLMATLEAAAAQYVVVRTGRHMGPGPAGIRRVEALLATLGKGIGLHSPHCEMVWWPDGIWDADAAQAVAIQCSVGRVVDPFVERAPDTGIATSTTYLRIQALGRQRRLQQGVVDRLAPWLPEHGEEGTSPNSGGPTDKRPVIAIASDDGLRDSRRLQRWMAGTELEDF